MPFTQDDLKKLQKNINSKEDLGQIAKSYNIKCSDNEIDEAFKTLNDNELNFDDLSNVSGGTASVEAEPTQMEIKCKCGNVFFVPRDGRNHNCPVCGRLHQAAGKKAKKQSFFSKFFNWC